MRHLFSCGDSAEGGPDGPAGRCRRGGILARSTGADGRVRGRCETKFYKGQLIKMARVYESYVDRHGSCRDNGGLMDTQSVLFVSG